MPVIDDSDEPPAKCCKYCEESTHGVDGPVSWRLTLDQDLIDTLKGSFPSWFQPQATNSSLNKTTTATEATTTTAVVNKHNNKSKNSNNYVTTLLTTADANNNTNKTTTAVTATTTNTCNGNSITITATSGLKNGINLLNNTICVTPITIETTTAAATAYSNFQQQPNLLSSINNSNTIHLHQLNGAAINTNSLSILPPISLTATCSSSASPASSITSNCSSKSYSTISSKKSQPINLTLNCKTNSKVNKYNLSSPSSTSSSCSSLSSASSSSSSSSSRSSVSSKSSNSKYPTKTYVKTHKNQHGHTTKSSPLNLTEINTTTAVASTAVSVTGTGTAGTTAFTAINNIQHQPIASVGATTITRVIPNSPSLHSLSGGSLLATFSSPGSATTFEIISDSSCTGLLTSAHLSGKSAFEHSFHDIILLQEAYDDMSVGEQRLNAPFLGGSSDDGTNSDFYDPRQSPPKAIVDSSPLQPQMDKNKESLKVKLMVRRPHSQLVEQGIIPPLKTSPAIHEQCKQLERAKTSDLLKAKIQQRPNREDLERRHILEEDECHIDPSLAEKQRMLKKARLADQLNSQIQHRPGPLELIKKNILHTEKPIEKIVKEGLVTFKATSEGLLTRPQHPNSYVTFEDDSQSSESDTRQTPPRLECPVVVTSSPNANAITASPSTGSDVLQAAAASAGIVTVALSIPTSAGQLMVTSTPPLDQTNLSSLTSNYIPPPPPPPLPNNNLAIKVKQETSNLYEELCQSVAGATNSHYLPLVNSPCSFASSTSTLSPLSSISSPPLSVTPRPVIQSPALQIAKSDAPGKDKNRKKCKNKPTSKTRTIKFHEYKGPPSAAHKLSSESSASTEETSYQLMLEQQNCLLKFLETLNKNQSIIPATSAATTTPTSSVVSTAGKTGSNAINTVTTATANTSTTANNLGQQTDVVSGQAGTIPAAASAAPRPPPLPSPALSVNSSIPPSPCTSYAESSASSLPDYTRLEKMKVSDLKMHLKKRNLPVSGPKPQLIERLRPYLPLDNSDAVTTPIAAATIENVSSAVEAMEHSDINSPKSSNQLEQEQMDVVQQQVDSPQPMTMQSVIQPQPQTATIILSNEELLREQQRKIDELQRQLQRSQQELLEIRQKQQQQQQQQQVHIQQQPPIATALSIQKNVMPNTATYKRQTVTAQLVNAVPTQQITLIATTNTAGAVNNNNNNRNVPQTLTLVQQQQPHHLKDISTPAKVTIKTNTNPVKSVVVPVPIINKKVHNQLQIIGNFNTTSSTTTTTTTPVMTQKMVVKQQLEAKIQKQKQAQAAAAAAQAQAAQAKAQAQAQVLAQAQAQALAQAQAQAQLRILTQKTQTVLIPTGPTITTNTTTTANASKTNDDKLKLKNISLKANPCSAPAGNNTATIVTNQLPLTKTHNNLGLVWNEGNQTIFLVGLNDQHMTAHTIGNISLANATPATKKLLNGHQRTNSLPSIVFPITTTQPVAMAAGNNLNEVKPLISQQQQQQQLHKLQLQQQPQQQQQLQQLLPQQQIIQLDIKPQNLQPPPPPPPPPPQYEEATKQLKAKQQEQQQHQQQQQQSEQEQQQQTIYLNPLIKIKEEPSSSASTLNVCGGSGNSTNSNSNLNEQKPLKSSIKSEKLNDVLDILIKQGDLPESALEPIAPVTTPLTPTGSNVQMNDLSDNLFYHQMEDNKNIIKQENLMETGNKKDITMTQQHDIHSMDMDCNNSCNNNNNNNNNLNINSIYEFYHKTTNANSEANNGNNNNNFIENIDMASPLQPECHMDNESVAKTLDMFLDRHHHQQQQQQQQQQQHQQQLQQQQTHHQTSPTHHDMLSKACLDSNSTRTTNSIHSNNSSEEAKLNHFDEFELLELMSQQLEMDIQEDSLSYQNQQQHQQQQQQQQTNQQNKNHQHSNEKTLCNGLSRNLNNTFPASLAQLMNTQMLSPPSGHNDSSTSHHHSSNILDDFDTDCFVQQLAQHQQQQHQSQQLNNQLHQQQQQQQQQQQHAQINNHNNNDNSNSNGSNNINNNYNNSTTPMDVCDDFDNPLSDFNFSTLSPDSNINTPPHPFGMTSIQTTTSPAAEQLNGNSLTTCGLQAQSSTSCNNPNSLLSPSQTESQSQMAALSAASSSGLPFLNMPMNSLLQPQCHHEQMSICTNTNGIIVGDGTAGLNSAMGGGDNSSNANDTFGSNSQDIFDLFNIDDYKMSWGEGDFAV